MHFHTPENFGVKSSFLKTLIMTERQEIQTIYLKTYLAIYVCFFLPCDIWWPMWVRARAASSKGTVSSVPAWFQADSGTNLIKQGKIITGRPCGSVAQWSAGSHGTREVLGSRVGRVICLFLPCDILISQNTYSMVYVIWNHVSVVDWTKSMTRLFKENFVIYLACYSKLGQFVWNESLQNTHGQWMRSWPIPNLLA